MREKEKKLVVTFYTTAGAMAMEKLCRRMDWPGRLISVPRCLTSDCGLAWCAPLSQRPVLEQEVKKQDMDCAGFYEVEL